MTLTLPTGSIDKDIYKGFWINQSLGTVRGATLTLDRQAGGLVIAFLALFIAATARSLWKIVRFLVHATSSTCNKQDGVYHQRQAILRNQPLALNAVLDFCRLGYAWRNRATDAPHRILPVSLLASAIAVASIAAGLLSSRILTTSRDEVLIDGRNCGVQVNDLNIQASTIETIMNRQSQKCLEDFAYSTQCYREGDTSQNELCETFATSTLPFTSDRNASCPFAGEICKSATGNILLDSGVLDSHLHLGLNRGPRFTLRHQTHCAPLNTKGFTDTVTTAKSSQSRQVYRYGNRYGPNGNETYVFAIDIKNEKPVFDGINIGNYKVSVLMTDQERKVEFLKELRKPNAFVSLLFLDATEVVYAVRTEDPWFSATTRVSKSNSSASGSHFVADEPVGVLGCVTERSYCNPALPVNVGCIDGFSIIGGDPFDSLARAWPDTTDQSTIRAFIAALSNQGAGLLDIYYAIPNSPSLLSRNTIMGNMQTAAIPKHRWQEEREHLYKASLAAIQSMMVDHARGFALGKNLYCIDQKICHRLCQSQKVRSAKHYSFNAWMLGVILLVGSTLVLISTFIEEIFALFLRYPRLRSEKLVYSYAEWQAGSTLQLQRLAHENLGTGNWTRTNEAIPVTEPGDTLAILDVTDAKHARMVVPSTELDVFGLAEGSLAHAKRPARYSRLPSTEVI
ncbi:uncharacterized protein CC84DRAFT_190654 [Paraphaeosphaeria sporulosa]|uniref:Uncharacterized protein n=1 Tax=Paraphaeosphaeria sporulosa TaxID=1460663 RepID=A0A177C1L0_9PLEO|nr:uncharacterized protein CC84DRAFT_190654 [Paraphaeosphaeria sporulosa]OAG01385.1 hypothetical protein CC84DRAFT_190654 [Paraphaeosphaeria sporulosa]